MLHVVHTTTHHTEAQRTKLRQYVIAQLADGARVVLLPAGCSMEQLSAPLSAGYVVQTEFHQTTDQLSSNRESVRTQLDDGKNVVVLPPGYTIKVLISTAIDTNVDGATWAIGAEAVRRYEARMKELGYEALAIPPAWAPPNIRLTRRFWPKRFWLSYKGWRKNMGVLDSVRAAWRISR